MYLRIKCHYVGLRYKRTTAPSTKSLLKYLLIIERPEERYRDINNHYFTENLDVRYQIFRVTTIPIICIVQPMVSPLIMFQDNFILKRQQYTSHGLAYHITTVFWLIIIPSVIWRANAKNKRAQEHQNTMHTKS